MTNMVLLRDRNIDMYRVSTLSYLRFSSVTKRVMNIKNE